MAASTIEEIFSFAIDKEKEAIAFYEALAGKAENPVVKDAILKMADEERKHEKMLMNINLKKLQFVKQPSQEDMKLSDYLVETPATKDMSYPDLLVIAMKREEKAYELYLELETRAGDDASRKVFTLLKGEELKHKTSLEREYEEGVLREG